MMDIAELFGQKGPFADRMDRYQPRPSQIKLAQAVEQCTLEGGVLLGEAGTGTGKTLAYLVPALLSGKKTVISTGTRNLQEQIFFKDLAFVLDALEIRPKVTYLKGQENYLCRTRLDSFLRSPRSLKYPSAKVALIERFGHATITGDRMELTQLGDDDPIWQEVCSTRETRIGQKCPYYDDCHVTLARKEAMSADLIVVNHHLYFAHLATRQRGGTILPNHDLVIFDEAHLIEDIATEFFSRQVSSARIERVVNDATAACAKAAIPDDIYADSRRALAHKTLALCADLFDPLAKEQGRRAIDRTLFNDQVIAAYHRLDASLEAFWLSLKQLEGHDEEVDHAAVRLVELRADLAALVDGGEKGVVYWVEKKRRSIILGSSPIDISEIFRQEVLFARESVMLCSATLSTHGTFDYLKGRLGIDFEGTELILPGPFDYDRQARLYLPKLPFPSDPAYNDEAAREVRDLLEMTGGGALFLCTSNRAVDFFTNHLLDQTHWRVLRQGDQPKRTLLEQLADGQADVLVATASFWQGVDIPGQALRLVIIDKLPFAVPNDPVVSARIDHLKERGEEPFNTYQLPMAALDLKQGFGRLVRTVHDRGVVAILDSRITQKRYGKTFLKSLPDAPVVTQLATLADWWNNAPHESA